MQISKIKLFPLSILLLLSVVLTACGSGGAMPDRAWPESLVDGNTIYMVNQSFVYAVDVTSILAAKPTIPEGKAANEPFKLDSPKENLQFFEKNNLRYPKDAEDGVTYGSAPVLFNGELILTDFAGKIRKGNFWCEDAQGCDEKGTKPPVITPVKDATGRYLTSATVTDTRILAANADHKLYAYDFDLVKKWDFSASDEVWTRPVVYGDLIFVASRDKQVYALRENKDANGVDVVWNKNLDGAVLHSLAVDEEGNLYVGTLKNELISLDAKTGDINWTYKTKGYVWSPVVFSGDRVYGADQSGNIFCLNKEKIQEKIPVWEYPVTSPIIGSVAIDGKSLFAGTYDGKAISISIEDTANPRLIWENNVGGKLLSTPVIAGNYAVFGVIDGDKALAAYSFDNKFTWTFKPSK